MSPSVLVKLGKAARTSLAAVGLFTVAGAFGVTLVYRRAREKPSLTLPEAGFILELDLEDVALVEKQRGGLQALLSKGHPKLELQRVSKALKAAGKDERVKGLFGTVGPVREAGLAQVQELRQAILLFRHTAGDRAASVAYSDSFGEGGAYGTVPYYLASAFEHVYMMPGGLLSFTGLAASQPFARGLLDRFKIKPLVFKREEYKSAVSYVTGTGFSDAERAATTDLLQDLSMQIVADVAAGRRLTSQAVQDAVDCAPHMADRAQALQLIDGVLYRDQAIRMVARLRQLKAGPPIITGDAQHGTLTSPAASATGGSLQAQQGQQQTVEWVLQPQRQVDAAKALLQAPNEEAASRLPRVPLQRYLRVVEAQQAQKQKVKQISSIEQAIKDLKSVVKEKDEDKVDEQAFRGRALSILGQAQLPTVAVVTLTGNIVLGRGDSSARSDGKQIASLPVIKVLQKLAMTPAIKAVVLRVDSPGGSAAASDAIHREISQLKQLGKKVVVSMGNTAASGGYLISCTADKIVAQPATLTGSIGVVSGKLVVEEFLREFLNVNMETIKMGKNADASSPFVAFSKEQEAQVNKMMDSVYNMFMQRVSDGRGIVLADVRKLAKGRVWTGQQALTAGLIDTLGGLEDAIQLAKEEARLPSEEDATIVMEVYPEQRSQIGKLWDLLNSSSSLSASPLQTALNVCLHLDSSKDFEQTTVLSMLHQTSQHISQDHLQYTMSPQLISMEATQFLNNLRY